MKAIIGSQVKPARGIGAALGAATVAAGLMANSGAAAQNVTIQNWVDTNTKSMLDACLSPTPFNLERMEKPPSHWTDKKVAPTPKYYTDDTWGRLSVSTNNLGTSLNGHPLYEYFVYVYPDQSLQAARIGLGKNIDYREIAEIANTRYLRPQADYKTTNITCGGVLSLNFNADTKLTAPAIATLKAGLFASTDASKNTTLNIVAGRFENPIIRALFDVRTADITKNAFYFMVIDWYSNSGSNPSKKYYLLKDMYGAVSTESTKSSLDASADAKLKMEANAMGYASINSDNSANVSFGVKDAQQFSSVFASRTEFWDVPAPSKLAADLASRLKGVLSDNSSQITTADQTVTIAYENMPYAQCASGKWTVQPTQESVKLANPTPKRARFGQVSGQYIYKEVTEADYEVCLVTLDIINKNGDVTTLSSQNLNYITSLAKDENGRALVFPAPVPEFSITKPFALTLARLGGAEVRQPIVDSNVSAGRQNLVWQVKYSYKRSINYRNLPTFTEATELMATCDNIKEPIVFAPATPSVSAGSTITLELKSEYDASVIQDKTRSNLTCALSGNLPYEFLTNADLPLKGSAQLPGIQLSMPNIYTVPDPNQK